VSNLTDSDGFSLNQLGDTVQPSLQPRPPAALMTLWCPRGEARRPWRGQGRRRGCRTSRPKGRTVNRPLAKPLTPPHQDRLPPNLPPFAWPGDALATRARKLGAGLAMCGQQLGHHRAVAVKRGPGRHPAGLNRGVNLGQQAGGQGGGIDRPGARMTRSNRTDRRRSRAKRPTANVARPGFGSCVVVNHGT
jgi:hypothetical protein